MFVLFLTSLGAVLLRLFLSALRDSSTARERVFSAHPSLNKGLRDLDNSDSKLDRRLSNIQDKVTGSLNIVSSLLSDFKQKKRA